MTVDLIAAADSTDFSVEEVLAFGEAITESPVDNELAGAIIEGAD